jgi:hypothetical protein
MKLEYILVFKYPKETNELHNISNRKNILKRLINYGIYFLKNENLSAIFSPK